LALSKADRAADFRAAVEALPYEKPKLAATFAFGVGRDLEEAIARSEGRLDVTPRQPGEADQ
jgi:hypothetical protein